MNIAVLIRNTILIIEFFAFGFLIAGKILKVPILTVIGTYISYCFVGIVLLMAIIILFHIVKQKFE